MICRLPVRPQVWSGPTDSGPVAEPSTENTETAIPTGLPGPGIHALDRFAISYRKASSSRPTSHKTRSVASLEGTRITRKGGPNHQVPASPFTMVAEGRQCPYRPTITPNITCSANIYRRIKGRVGRSHRRAHCKRSLLTSGKQAAYKLSRTKSSLSGLKRVPATDNTTVVSYINKEGGIRSGPLCTLLWRILTWCTRKQVTLKPDTFQAR